MSAGDECADGGCCGLCQPSGGAETTSHAASPGVCLLCCSCERIAWTAEEEFLVAQAHAAVGPRWALMTRRLPCRAHKEIDSHFNSNARHKDG